MDISSLVRPHLRDLKPYSSARDEFDGVANVFLDANENPHGSAAGDEWNRYPDPHQEALKELISNLKGAPTENIFLGNGSDEPIDLLIRAFCEPGRDRIMSFPPTYGMYNVSAAIHDVPIDKVLLTPDFQLDLRAIRSRMEKAHKITFLCSPNNPSGNDLSLSDMEEVLKVAPGLVVVDEAYIDFSARESLIARIGEFPNLIVLQTFSKAWGMAALRVGMAFASTEIIRYLNKIKPPYNIPGPIQQLAQASIQNGKAQVEEWIANVLTERKRLADELNGLGAVRKVHPSDANFFLVEFDGAENVFKTLTEKGIIVRDRRSHPLCADCLRLTIGTREENDQLLRALRAF